MTSSPLPPTSPSFLDFFVLEANEYVEQIDALLLRATADGPDAEALQRLARALRGSATMAKLQSFAELAAALEAVGRSFRARALAWEPAVRGALTAAVDDLKLFVRAARAWSPAQDQAALKRASELSAFATAGLSRTPTGVPANPAFLAAETNNIAAGLELLATRPEAGEGAANVLRRVRALRGVAGVRDVATLGLVLEAAESVLRRLEAGGRLDAEHVAVLRTAADVMRAVATASTGGAAVTDASPQVTAFTAAVEALRTREETEHRVVPIAELFFDDAGPHVVHAAPNPPTSPKQRFRMEVVSLGEHVQRIIGEVRAAVDAASREQTTRALRRALREIKATAESFGEVGIAASVEVQLSALGAGALDAIVAFASSMSPGAFAPTPVMLTAQRQGTPPGAPPAQRVTPRSAPTPPITPAQPPAPPTPPPAAPAPARSPFTPAAGHARVFPAPVGTRREPNTLDGAIAAFDSLAHERLADPVELPEDVVPVGALVYRGRAALDRALELRDAMRRSGGAPAPEMLEELYDLLELARAE